MGRVGWWSGRWPAKTQHKQPVMVTHMHPFSSPFWQLLLVTLLISSIAHSGILIGTLIASTVYKPQILASPRKDPPARRAASWQNIPKHWTLGVPIRRTFCDSSKGFYKRSAFKDSFWGLLSRYLYLLRYGVFYGLKATLKFGWRAVFGKAGLAQSFDLGGPGAVIEAHAIQASRAQEN